MPGAGPAGEFATRSTARRARTIMARKLSIGVLLAVTLQLHFRNSVPTVTGHPGSVRQLWHPHGKADKMIAGRENGQIGCGERRRRMTRKTGQRVASRAR